MSSPGRRPGRILVALDNPETGELELLAALGEDVEAELEGLFVEDIDLLNLAGLPFAEEVTVRNGAARRMEREHLEHQLRSRAARVQRALEEAARQLRMRHSFRVIRGEVIAELLRAAEEADALVVGRHSWIGGTVRRLAEAAPRTLILLAPGSAVGRTAVVLYDGSEEAGTALALAGRMARTGHLGLSVLLAVPKDGDFDALRNEAAQRLGELPIPVRYRRIGGLDVASLVDASHTEQARVLVLPAGHPELDPDTARTLVSRAGCSLVLAR